MNDSTPDPVNPPAAPLNYQRSTELPPPRFAVHWAGWIVLAILAVAGAVSFLCLALQR
jgi:hypothetical protein